MEVLLPINQSAGMNIQSIKDCFTGHEISQKSFSTHLTETEVTYPTIALADTTSGVFQFCHHLESSAPLPLRSLFFRAQAIANKASLSENNPMRHIHVARAALHLVVCAISVLSIEFSNRDLPYVLELQSVLEAVSKSIYEDSLLPFNQLCGDFFGAVTVRRSYEAYQQFQRVETPDQREVLVTLETSSQIVPLEVSDIAKHSKFLRADAVQFGSTDIEHQKWTKRSPFNLVSDREEIENDLFSYDYSAPRTNLSKTTGMVDRAAQEHAEALGQSSNPPDRVLETGPNSSRSRNQISEPSVADDTTLTRGDKGHSNDLDAEESFHERAYNPNIALQYSTAEVVHPHSNLTSYNTATTEQLPSSTFPDTILPSEPLPAFTTSMTGFGPGTIRLALNDLKQQIPVIKNCRVNYIEWEEANSNGYYALWRCRCKIENTNLVTAYSPWRTNKNAAREESAALMITLIRESALPGPY
ncbi:hypothetical protein FRC17_000252 [Serendipita sp. 399]|nr:hypothetical protein FRC17_000252 [Serendipita sp. 399]